VADGGRSWWSFGDHHGGFGRHLSININYLLNKKYPTLELNP